MSVFWQGIACATLTALGLTSLYAAAVFGLSVLYHLAGVR